MTEEQVIEIRRLAGGARRVPKPFSERRKTFPDVVGVAGRFYT